MYNKTLTTNQM